MTIRTLCLHHGGGGKVFKHQKSPIDSGLGVSVETQTPYEVFRFLYGATVPGALNIQEIDRDAVILNPRLIYSKGTRK